MHGATMPKVPHGAAGVAGTGTPRARQRKLPKFRVVCQGDDKKITLRAKAEDPYEAFEQISCSYARRGSIIRSSS
ncbi:MAG: hypothetical protein H0T60_19285 [Acidobacteria bacterium]|nr:hypothetical protein [Acidobacteriota bacterium]